MLYFDANGGSRPRLEALSALDLLIQERHRLGNPSSIHTAGQRSRSYLSSARRDILRFLDLREDQVKLVFTSGGTESCNLMVLGFLSELPASAHIVSSSIEHPAMLETLRYLGGRGFGVSLVDPRPSGYVQPDELIAHVRESTELVTLMGANNETGAIQPIVETARRLRGSGYRGLIVSDCAQLFGKSDVSGRALIEAGVDAFSISGPKLGSISGIGAVILATSTKSCREFIPQIRGGSQEFSLRGGSENLYGIVSLGAVCRKLAETGDSEVARLVALRELFWKLLQENCEPVEPVISTAPEDSSAKCLSNTLSVRFPSCRGDDLVVALDLHGLQASTGSACASGKQGESHVLLSMGLTKSQAREVVRFSFDYDATEDSIREASRIVRTCVRLARDNHSSVDGAAAETEHRVS